VQSVADTPAAASPRKMASRLDKEGITEMNAYRTSFSSTAHGPSFANWDALDAELVVFTTPFSDSDEVVRRLAGSTYLSPCGNVRSSPPRF
jgi:hypothetical protein